MSLTCIVDGDLAFIEGPRGQRVAADAREISVVLEACFSARTRRALLYAENLPDSFFDLSSQQAGEILQKLRNYGVRLAVVNTGGTVISSLFPEMRAEERKGRAFGMFETREAAIDWLRN